MRLDDDLKTTGLELGIWLTLTLQSLASFNMDNDRTRLDFRNIRYNDFYYIMWNHTNKNTFRLVMASSVLYYIFATVHVIGHLTKIKKVSCASFENRMHQTIMRLFKDESLDRRLFVWFAVSLVCCLTSNYLEEEQCLYPYGCCTSNSVQIPSKVFGEERQNH